jgi:hypothetical protein
MPNEFVTRNGFISKNDSTITGSLTVTGGLTGSILSASYAITASYSPNSVTASYVVSAITASYSSYAVTASYALSASVRLKPSYAPTVGLQTYIGPYLCASETSASFLSSQVGLDNIVLTPILINRDCTLVGVGVSLASTASGVTTNARLGLYADSGIMLPGSRISDLAFVNTTSASAQYKEIGCNIPLSAKTIYWVAVVGDNALRLPIPSFNNTLLNPLLGYQLTSSGATTAQSNICVMNITNYVTASIGSNTSLPSSLSQVASTYTICSYFSASSYIGPIINVTY